eukprot:3808930-Rhodomonas_salina.2
MSIVLSRLRLLPSPGRPSPRTPPCGRVDVAGGHDRVTPGALGRWEERVEAGSSRGCTTHACAGGRGRGKGMGSQGRGAGGGGTPAG